jgi:S1-C subfamily serine protease
MQINHGNSGGPAYLSSDGAIIGIADAYLSPRDHDELNLGLAVIVPIRHVLELAKQVPIQRQ